MEVDGPATAFGLEAEVDGVVDAMKAFIRDSCWFAREKFVCDVIILDNALGQLARTQLPSMKQNRIVVTWSLT